MVSNAAKAVLIVVLLLIKPLGGYMTRVFTGGRTFLDPVLVPIERFIYKVTGINAARQMGAKHYTIAFLMFSLVGTLLLYALLRLQMFLPWYDHTHLTTPMTPDLAAQTALAISRPAASMARYACECRCKHRMGNTLWPRMVVHRSLDLDANSIRWLSHLDHACCRPPPAITNRSFSLWRGNRTGISLV